MTDTTHPQDTLLTLPSDQDASGRTLGEEELALLAKAIHSGTLTSTKGRFVPTLEQQFAGMLGVKHVYACSSGTSAIHTAIAAINPDPGDEIITSPITDMGALTPILYQGARSLRIARKHFWRATMASSWVPSAPLAVSVCNRANTSPPAKAGSYRRMTTP